MIPPELQLVRRIRGARSNSAIQAGSVLASGFRDLGMAAWFWHNFGYLLTYLHRCSVLGLFDPVAGVVARPAGLGRLRDLALAVVGLPLKAHNSPNCDTLG
jgi:hypothetical protein